MDPPPPEVSELLLLMGADRTGGHRHWGRQRLGPGAPHRRPWLEVTNALRETLVPAGHHDGAAGQFVEASMVVPHHHQEGTGDEGRTKRQRGPPAKKA